jgi:hypothetical protein
VFEHQKFMNGEAVELQIKERDLLDDPEELAINVIK